MSTFTTEEWDRRRNFITASEVPALFGLDSFATPGDVQSRKLLVVKQDDGSNEAATLGHEFEDALVSIAGRKKKIDFTKRQHWAEAPNGVMACTLDGLSEDKTIACEAKTSLFASAESLENWGEDGTDDVPLRVYFQTWAHMICVPTVQAVLVPALVRNRRGISIYRIERDDDELDKLETKILEWHEKHIVNKEPVSLDDAPSLDTMKRVSREQGKKIALDNDRLFLDAVAAKEALTIAEKNKERLQAILIAAMGDAETAVFNVGEFSYREESAGKRIDVDGLRAAHPEIYEEFATPSTRMMPRFKIYSAKAK